jgi:pyridoxal phosphate enzyme (YggS family)
MNSELASRYQQIMRRISALAGGAGRVTLIAVSKSQPYESIEALYSLGHRDFGENYAQELVEKAEKLNANGCRDIRWHFIGHLQTNKVKSVVGHLHSVHSIDSEKLAVELGKRWSDVHGTDGKRLSSFLEVNIDGEASKSGVLPADAPRLASSVAALSTSLRLEGLMAIPSAGSDAAARSHSFAALRELELKCRPHTSGLLSMGMSSDFELAIPQGASHIRVGTALFGERQ